MQIREIRAFPCKRLFGAKIKLNFFDEKVQKIPILQGKIIHPPILEQRVIGSELASDRNDLLLAIKIDEDNRAEIMRIARHYFLELGGNSIASKPFAGWATRHHIDISELYTQHNDLKFYMDNPDLCYEAYHKATK